MAYGCGGGRLSGRFFGIMNLQLNFIRPSEIRSASMVSVKALVQIGAIVIPLVFALYMAALYIGHAEEKSAKEVLSGNWDSLAAKERRATELDKKLTERREIRNRLAGWSESRLNWSELLHGLRAEVPVQVQLKVLKARQNMGIGENGHAQRAFSLTINGRCVGPAAEERVQALEASWSETIPLDELVKQIRLADFEVDIDPNANPEDRIFQMEIQLKPRSLHAVAGK